MEVKPHAKWKTKKWLELLTYSISMMLLAIPLHFLFSLSEKLTVSEAGLIAWIGAAVLIIPGWLFFIPWVPLYYNNLHYRIEEDRININKGIISKESKNVPYRAITDFVLHRTLFDRILGIGTIRVQTAGQSMSATGYEANLSGLVNYEELHQNLIDRLRKMQSGTDATGSPETMPESVDQVSVLKEMLTELKAIRKALDSK